MTEVYPGIYMITLHTYFKAFKPPINIYVMPGKENGLVFDAGYGNRKHVAKVISEINKIKSLDKVKKNNLKIDEILISHAHPDHFSGLNKLKKSLGLSIVLTEMMAELIKSGKNYRESYLYIEMKKGNFYRFKYRIIKFLSIIGGYFYKWLYGISYISEPDKIIKDNAEIVINNEKWKIFPSPGHSDDHISLYNEKDGILLAGDNILRSKTSWLGPPKSDLLKYVDSMEEIRRLPKLKLILSAHGSPITNPQERIKQIIDWRIHRIEDVFNVISDAGSSGITFKNIFKQLYPGEGYIKYKMVEGWIRLTLKYLIEKKRILQVFKRGKGYYILSL